MERDIEKELASLPRLNLPPYHPPSPEEIERRRKLFDDTMKLREKIGPIGLSVEELLSHEDIAATMTVCTWLSRI